MERYRCRLAGALFGALVFVVVAAKVASAEGLNGQPVATAEVKGQLASAVRDLVRVGGDVGKARPALLLLVEKNATMDLTGGFASAIGDTEIYQGVVTTYLDHLDAAASSGRDRAYLHYNLARVYIYRASKFPTGSARSRLLSLAADQVTAIETEGTRDPAAAELRGDIADARGEIEEAVSAYGRMAILGGTKRDSAYKTGRAYANARRYGLAARWLRTAAQAANASSSTDPFQAYTIQQELAAAYFQDGDAGASAQALRQSAIPLGTLTTPPAPLRLDVARWLLSRTGYARDVRAYLEAVVALEPDDANAKALLARARAAGR